MNHDLLVFGGKIYQWKALKTESSVSKKRLKILWSRRQKNTNIGIHNFVLSETLSHDNSESIPIFEICFQIMFQKMVQ